MTSHPTFTAIIVAAGRGLRAGLPLPKQFAMLGDRPVLRWSVDAFAGHPACDRIIVVAPDDDRGMAMAIEICSGSGAQVVPGGSERIASVKAGLDAADNADFILVHDAARPGLTCAQIDRLTAAVADPAIAGAVPVLPVADTLAWRDGERITADIDRSSAVRVQTPQAFRRAALVAAHSVWVGSATDDASMVRSNGDIVLAVEGDPRLDKITNDGDLEAMQSILVGGLPQWRTAVGNGFDVHRLVAGDGVWIGGHFIVHDRKLEGHSDADVLLHAITDAVLGALGAGDIGQHFPPSDERWRGAASDAFLAHACHLANAKGGVIEHVDATVICEAPKIGPHREAIRERIAAIMGLELEQVSVKATTTEKLGFTGRGEGISAMASASLSLPRRAQQGG
ncbi:MAG: 2-C-methyl-D-erythritol 2,4-cyclodiphosphate synthase [Sphingopyxis sp.]|nr:2-C-methyl-D-erythritol 2,4-cyclodiphosphate synthase [Sphingopyxis sp.]